jgi:tetratricopeptide (TPR) repeat protein
MNGVRQIIVIGVVVGLAGCQKGAPTADASCRCAPISPQPPASAAAAPVPARALRAEPTVRGPHVEPLAVCDAQERTPLEAARSWAEAQQYEQALSCAAQAAALDPGDVLAHSERGHALTALGRLDEAKLAIARALAVDPESPDALLGGAHLYSVALPSSREHDELGVAYAERGFELAAQDRDAAMGVRFARLAAMAFNDLGQSIEALDRAEWVLERVARDPEATYERAFALFELCRFPDAKRAFEAQLEDHERAAHVQYHLGLLLEREGRLRQAEEHFAKARALEPDDFPAPVLVPSDEFYSEVEKVRAGLPADVRRDLAGVSLSVEDLPQLSDLTAGDPPLSPTILGLFRGPSLREACDAPLDAGSGTAGSGAPCRSIALYRKNLARAVKSRAELVEQIRVTLLHEVGHLRGEDDFELAARGLE